jgi:hypothetical protein
VVTLADEEIQDAVLVDVGERRPVRLRERDTAGIPIEEAVHDHVTHERDLAGRVALLFVPREAEPVAFERRDHVIQLVAVDVVNPHFGAPGAPLRRAPAAQFHRMVRPQLLAAPFGRL